MNLAAAIAAAGRVAAKADGTKVKIKRGELETECVPALRGSTRFQTVSTDNQNVLIEIRSLDFLVMAEAYDFGEGPVEPEREDQIIVVDGDNTCTHELLDIPDQPFWRWSDSYKTRLRLHTKEIPSA